MSQKFIGKRVQVEHVVMSVRVPQKVQQRIAPLVASKTCVIAECGNPSSARGLCPTCRAASKSAINNGLATEEDLIRQGMLLPLQKTGRTARSKFAQQLQAATE